MATVPITKSTAQRPPTASTFKPRVSLTGKRGTYQVQSGTDPGVFYTTTAASCSCPARKPCKHMAAVKRLNVAFYLPKTPMTRPSTPSTPPATALDAPLAAAERLLAIKRRALTDTDRQSDEYAVLLRAVNQAERAVAALDASAMRAA